MKKKVLYIISFLLMVLLAVNIGILIYLNSSAVRVKNQLELAQRYLTDMEYEEAIAAFEAVIEIEPKNTEAWLGIVEAYICQGDFDNALKYAEKGYEATDDERLLEKLEMLESGNVTDYLGRIHKRSTYDGEGNLLYWIEHSYGKNGREDMIVAYDADGTITAQVQCEYNEMGLPTIYYNTTRDSIQKTMIEYDENGNRVKMYFCDENGELGEYVEYEYDENGHMIKSQNFDMNGNFSFGSVYIYDEKGNQIECDLFDMNNNITRREVHEYDENNKELRCDIYLQDGLLYYFLYEYDENGKFVRKSRYNPDGTLDGYEE